MASEQLQTIIDLLRSQPLIDADFPARRANMEAGASLWPVPEGSSVEPVDAGGVSCEWVGMPGVATDRAVLYVHGGAYTTGSLATHRRHVAQLAGATGARVLNVDYRLAPEHPHPAAVDDAVAAFRWLTSTGGIEPQRVVLSGDSAGGGLAVATLLAFAGRRRPAPDPVRRDARPSHAAVPPDDRCALPACRRHVRHAGPGTVARAPDGSGRRRARHAGAGPPHRRARRRASARRSSACRGGATG